MPISDDGQRDRYSIAEGDFRAALEYISKAREYEQDLIAQEALIAMAILCYARPFSNNERNKNARVASKVSWQALDALSPPQRMAHEKYCNLRNKAIAHSESSHHPTEFDKETGLTKISRFTFLFHSVDLDELENLVRQVQEICRRERIVYNA